MKGLLRLGDEVERRDKELGRRQPEALNRRMIDLLRYTDEARALQLERDRQAFLKNAT